MFKLELYLIVLLFIIIKKNIEIEKQNINVNNINI